MPRNAIITDGFTSINVALVKDGYADLQIVIDLTFPIEELPAEAFNYANNFINPQYQEEIRGGRTELRPVILTDFNSLSKIRGFINSSTRDVIRLDFISEEKIRGSLDGSDRITINNSFNSKKKIRGSLNSSTRAVTNQDFSSRKKL